MATATTRRKASLSSAKRINVVFVVDVVVKSTMSSEAAKNVNITSYYSPVQAEKSVFIRLVRFIRFAILPLWLN